MGWEEDRVSSGRDDVEQGSLNSITYLESTLYNKETALMTSTATINIRPPLHFVSIYKQATLAIACLITGCHL